MLARVCEILNIRCCCRGRARATGLPSLKVGALTEHDAGVIVLGGRRWVCTTHGLAQPFAVEFRHTIDCFKWMYMRKLSPAYKMHCQPTYLG